MSVATFRTEWVKAIVTAHSVTRFAILSTARSIYMPFGHCYFYNHPSFYVFVFDFTIGNGVVVIAVVVFTAYRLH